MVLMSMSSSLRPMSGVNFPHIVTWAMHATSGSLYFSRSNVWLSHLLQMNLKSHHHQVIVTSYVCSRKTPSTMAQMTHFSFPYYFTIPNSEFRNLHYNFGIRNCEVYIIWASGNSQSTLEGILNSQAKTKGSTT